MGPTPYDAHSWAVDSNHTDKLRLKKLILRIDGTAELIRCKEGVEDSFPTLNFDPAIPHPTP